MTKILGGIIPGQNIPLVLFTGVERSGHLLSAWIQRMYHHSLKYARTEPNSWWSQLCNEWKARNAPTPKSDEWAPLVNMHSVHVNIRRSKRRNWMILQTILRTYKFPVILYPVVNFDIYFIKFFFDDKIQSIFNRLFLNFLVELNLIIVLFCTNKC